MQNYKKEFAKKASASILIASIAVGNLQSINKADAFEVPGWLNFSKTQDPQEEEIKDLKNKLRIDALRGEQLTSTQEFIIMADQGKEVLTDYAKALMPLTMISFALTNFGKAVESMKNIYASASNVVSNWIFKMTAKGINVDKYKELLEKIEKRLRAELVGQDEAINKILKVITGHFEAMLEARCLGKKYEKGLVLYFIGSPATGKSTVMKIIEEEMGLRSYVGRMSDAVEDKGNNANTVVARLTKPVIVDNGKVKVSVDTPFTKCLKSKISTLYCIDEIDKMRSLDSILRKTELKNSNGKIVSGSIDEMLRNFGDTGQINGINQSGSVLIATSNETEDDMKQLEDSLYNRYQNCVIKFKDLAAVDYKEIIKRKTVPTQEFYKNKFNVNVIWSNTALDYLAQSFEKENIGARVIDSLLNDARYVLQKFRCENSKSTDMKNKTLTLDYNEVNKELFVKQN